MQVCSRLGQEGSPQPQRKVRKDKLREMAGSQDSDLGFYRVGRSHWRVPGRWIQDCSGDDKSIEKVVQNGNDVWTHETVGSGMCFEDEVGKIFVGCKKNEASRM